MLCLENVKKTYKDFELDCSMKVEAGCITGLIGPNGAGKSTAFKAALGLIHTDGGKIEIFDKSPEGLVPEDRRRMGVVLADSGFCAYFTIRDLFPVLEKMYPRFTREDFVHLCERFRLPLNKKIKEFSTGMKRKLQIVAAITHEADLLILDEPTSGMDVIAREQVLNLLREYMETEGRSILISSHISTDLEGFCDDIYLIDQGKILLHEETDTLLNQYGLLKMTEEQYEKLDRSYLLRRKKEGFGYSCLTDQKQFYRENYPEIVIENGTIDEVIVMMNQGVEL